MVAQDMAKLQLRPEMVLVAVEVRDCLPFHVGLAGEDEDLDRLRRIRRAAAGNAPCQQKSSQHKSLTHHSWFSFALLRKLTVRSFFWSLLGVLQPAFTVLPR